MLAYKHTIYETTLFCNNAAMHLNASTTKVWSVPLDTDSSLFAIYSTGAYCAKQHLVSIPGNVVIAGLISIPDSFYYRFKAQNRELTTECQTV